MPKPIADTTDRDLRSLIGALDVAPVAEYEFAEDIALQARRKLRVVDTIRAMHARRMLARRNSMRAFKRKRAALAITAAGMGFGAAGMVPPVETAHSQVAAYEAGTLQYAADRQHPARLAASDALREAMIEEEGVRSRVYRDVAGYLTVGIGHLVRPRDGLSLGDTVSRDRILDFFDEDLALAEAAARRLAGDTPLFQNEFDALVDLVYNVGEGNVSNERSPRLNAALEDGDYRAVAEELEYTTARGQVANGLVYRSQRRARMFLNGVYDDPRDAA